MLRVEMSTPLGPSWLGYKCLNKTEKINCGHAMKQFFKIWKLHCNVLTYIFLSLYSRSTFNCKDTIVIDQYTYIYIYIYIYMYISCRAWVEDKKYVCTETTKQIKFVYKLYTKKSTSTIMVQFATLTLQACTSVQKFMKESFPWCPA